MNEHERDAAWRRLVLRPGGLFHLLVAPGGIDYPEIVDEARKMIEDEMERLDDAPIYGCDRPPSGWACNLPAGHEGPCPTLADPSAAREAAEDWEGSWVEDHSNADAEHLRRSWRSLLSQPPEVREQIEAILRGEDR